jgi:DNA polymerase-4
MDAFYAAVEQLDDPKLRNRPILVGPKGGRGVVLTASYEARPFNVGSGMPMVEARRRCPEALIVPPRFERYRELSRRIMNVFDNFSPDVEPISLDEAFLDMSGAEHLFGSPENMGMKLKRAVQEATGGLTASVGISATKFVAKVASAFQKPDGLTIVPAGRAIDWLSPQPVSVLWGAGPKTQQRLAALGFNTVGDIAQHGPDAIERALGQIGRRFFALATATDARDVQSSRNAKSLSSERTLNRDVSDPVAVRLHLRKAADVLAARLRENNLVANGVRVKLKRADFRTVSRQRQLKNPTDGSDLVYTIAIELADALLEHAPFRLIGIGAYDLQSRKATAQIDMLDQASGRAGKLDKLVDEARARFGPGSLRRARQVADQTVLDEAPNMDFMKEKRRF